VKLTLPQALALLAATALVCVGVFTGKLDDLIQKVLLVSAGIGTVYALFVNPPAGGPKDPGVGGGALALVVALGFALGACGDSKPTPAEVSYTAEVHACTLIEEVPAALNCVNLVDCKYGRPECVR